MAGLIDENVVDDILGRINIVEIISERIPLKRAGRNFKAPCPFHHEKTPSFLVSPDKQIYHCFGCGVGGNAVNFLMQYDRLAFPEAIEMLARRSGVIIPKKSVSPGKSSGFSTAIAKINQLAADYYFDNLHLPDGSSARSYLIKRGIRQETAKLFKLGFAQDKWDGLLNFLRLKGIDISLIEKAGLILNKESGGYYDRFRNRIIFPIFDSKSSVIGFGARVLDKSLPKYINSPETPVYTKGKNLYGLNFSKDHIRDTDSAVVVEGYLDFIIPFQAGLCNIVASLGTALTQDQVRLLKRFTENVVMVYDPDVAGEIATLRSLDIFIEADMNVKVVTLPQGYDPDSFVGKHGIDAFKQRINDAAGLFDYKLKVLKTRFQADTIESKAKISSEMLLTISKIKNEVLKSEYLKRLSQELKINEEALLQEIKKVKQGYSFAQAADTVSKKPLDVNATEKLLIKLMLEENRLVEEVKNMVEPSDFQDERTSKIVSMMFDFVTSGRHLDTSCLLTHFKDDDISQLICESTFLPEVSSEHKETVVKDCILRLKKNSLNSRKKQLQHLIKLAEDQGDEERLNELKYEFNILIKKG